MERDPFLGWYDGRGDNTGERRGKKSMTTITTEAVFEDGVLRPVQPLPLSANQRVRLVVQIPAPARDWPEDVAAIYREIADEDRRLAAAMEGTVRRTWPAAGEQP